MRRIATGRFVGRVMAGLLVFSLAGCQSLALSVFGVGASASVTQRLNGYAYRTFTAPSASVKQAALTALDRMGIPCSGMKREGSEEIIRAKAADRDIEINLETLSPKATRMRAVARTGVLVDGATAQEIVLQTEKALAKG
jgi:hypothetical protein